MVVDIQNALPNNTETAALTLQCGGASLVLKLGDHYTESVKMDQSLGCTAVWLPFLQAGMHMRLIETKDIIISIGS